MFAAVGVAAPAVFVAVGVAVFASGCAAGACVAVGGGSSVTPALPTAAFVGAAAALPLPLPLPALFVLLCSDRVLRPDAAAVLLGLLVLLLVL